MLQKLWYPTHRVFKKEGPKVLGYYTTKRCILGAAEGFIWTIIAQHLIIYIKILKYAPLKFILRQLYFNINFADLGYFRPTLTNFLHKNASYLLNFWSIDPLKIPMGSLDSILESLGIYLEKKFIEHGSFLEVFRQKKCSSWFLNVIIPHLNQLNQSIRANIPGFSLADCQL